MPADKLASREAVLDAFAVELEPGRATLERYLRLYPEYAEALIDLSLVIDLSLERSREYPDESAPLSDEDLAIIDAAWSLHAAARPVAADPFAPMSIADWRSLAQVLDVPRQVVTALRERRIVLTSIPRRFLGQLAEAMRSSVAELEVAWGPVPVAATRSYKADGKPVAGEQVTFEQVLIEAGVSPDRRAQLLAD